MSYSKIHRFNFGAFAFKYFNKKEPSNRGFHKYYQYQYFEISGDHIKEQNVYFFEKVELNTFCEEQRFSS